VVCVKSMGPVIDIWGLYSWGSGVFPICVSAAACACAETEEIRCSLDGGIHPISSEFCVSSRPQCVYCALIFCSSTPLHRVLLYDHWADPVFLVGSSKYRPHDSCVDCTDHWAGRIPCRILPHGQPRTGFRIADWSTKGHRMAKWVMYNGWTGYIIIMQSLFR